MEVLGDVLLARESGTTEHSSRLEIPGDSSTRYTSERFSRMAKKTANYLARYGLGPDRPLGLVDDTAPAPVLGLYAAGLLGAPVGFGVSAIENVACLIGPMALLERLDIPPRIEVVGYGIPGDDPRIPSFEETVTRENPGFLRTPIDRSTPLIQTDDQPYNHRAVLDSAKRVVSEHSLDAGNRVTVRAPMSEPGTIVTGLVAPVIADATIVLSKSRNHGDVLLEDEKSVDARQIDPREYRPRS